MTLRRRSAVALATCCLCLWVTAGRGQQPANPPSFRAPPRAGDALTRVRQAKAGEIQFNNVPVAKAIKEDMKVVTRNLIYPATDPKYVAPQDRVTKDGISPPIPDDKISTRIAELKAFIHEPASGTKLTVNQTDYIVAFGEATADVFRELKLNDDSVPDYLRVNAGQMLAVCSRSGSPAMAVYVTELLNDPKTRPELLVYALQAAEGLLAAYNPNNTGTAAREYDHFPARNDLFNLVKAIEAITLRDKPYVRAAAKPTPPPPLADTKGAKEAKDAKAAPATKPADPKAPPPPAATPKAPPAPAGTLVADPAPAMTPEQTAVFRYIRRAAVRALAQVRYPVLATTDGTQVIRPVYTLAKFAVMDASLTVTPAPDEVAEAVIGLCNVKRLTRENVSVNPDVLIDCVAAGLANFARPKTDDNENKLLPWAKYSGRLLIAMKGLKTTLEATSNATRAAGKFDGLQLLADGQLLNPIYRLGAGGQNPPALEGLVQWRGTNPIGTGTLFIELPNLKLVPADRRAVN